MKGWIKVTEFLPVEGERVTVKDDNGRLMAGTTAYRFGGGWLWAIDDIAIPTPTHWRPIEGGSNAIEGGSNV